MQKIEDIRKEFEPKPVIPPKEVLAEKMVTLKKLKE